jgi:hypothetical protein
MARGGRDLPPFAAVQHPVEYLDRRQPRCPPLGYFPARLVVVLAGHVGVHMPECTGDDPERDTGLARESRCLCAGPAGRP